MFSSNLAKDGILMILKDLDRAGTEKLLTKMKNGKSLKDARFCFLNVHCTKMTIG